MAEQNRYFRATLHPLPCLLFLLPLLVAYELGVLWLEGSQPDTLRNGADSWLRWALEAFGLSQLFWAPILIAGILILWTWFTWRNRPSDIVGIVSGMTIESVVFALGLWGVSRGLGPLIDLLGVKLIVPSGWLRPFAPPVQQAAGQIITYVGAGIYEETLFRLVLFSGVCFLLRKVSVPGPLSVGLSAVASALLFAAAHHVGPFGEPFDGYIFLFRSLAGVYFATLYQLRGFGVAVGAHAAYDVLVGVAVG